MCCFFLEGLELLGFWQFGQRQRRHRLAAAIGFIPEYMGDNPILTSDGEPRCPSITCGGMYLYSGDDIATESGDIGDWTCDEGDGDCKLHHGMSASDAGGGDTCFGGRPHGDMGRATGERTGDGVGVGRNPCPAARMFCCISLAWCMS